MQKRECPPGGGEVSEVFAWDFVLEEALPINENVPLRDDMVACGAGKFYKAMKFMRRGEPDERSTPCKVHDG